MSLLFFSHVSKARRLRATSTIRPSPYRLSNKRRFTTKSNIWIPA